MIRSKSLPSMVALVFLLFWASSCTRDHDRVNPFDPVGPDITVIYRGVSPRISPDSFHLLSIGTGAWYSEDPLFCCSFSAYSVDDPLQEIVTLNWFPLPSISSSTNLKVAQLDILASSSTQLPYLDIYQLDGPFNAGTTLGTLPPYSFFMTITPTVGTPSTVDLHLDMRSYFFPRMAGTTPFYGFITKARTLSGGTNGSAALNLTFAYKPQ